MYTFPEILIRWLIMGALMLFMVVVSMSHNLNDSKLQTKYKENDGSYRGCHVFRVSPS